MTHEEKIAWAAGFFEGEGSVRGGSCREALAKMFWPHLGTRRREQIMKYFKMRKQQLTKS